jgi:undecaprenyl pyrophosphate phosphatase UppP
VALTQLIILAVLQSLIAVFPVVAEGHFTLISQILHWPQPGNALRLVLCIGLVLGVAAYFCRDLAEMVVDVIRAAKGKRNPDARLA